MKHWYRRNQRMASKMDELLKDIYRTFGWKTRAVAPFIGMYACAAIKLEEKRLANGWKYEPPTFYEKNAAALALESIGSADPNLRTPKKLVLRGKSAPVYSIKGTK